jgi:myosin heavy subunit
VEDTISILRGLKERYEVHHGVRITDSATIAAATLSHRYISDRFLPDKAIDLVDEAASRLRMAIDSKPQALDEVDRDIMQLEIEREALKKEKDKASKERLAKLEEELANLKEESNALATRWQAEKEAIVQVQTIKEEMDQAKVQIEQAQREMDYQKAAELQYGRLHELEQSLKAAKPSPERTAAGRRAAQRRSRRRRHRPHRRQMDGHPGHQTAGRRDRKAGLHGRAAAYAGDGAGRGDRRGGGRRAPQPLRPARPQPAHRLLHLPGADRRGQNGTGAGAGRVLVRRRAATWCAST